ncbi:MAG: response regulator [Desulfovibrio sp.]|jgi:putative two-component system response regulator|nr:response regulator [Desulfovibrio sp.]
MEYPRKLIMLVDDNRTNLLAGKTALSEDYTVLTVPSASKMLQALEWRKPELILLDVDMPEMDGFEAINILKEHRETRDIPIIFLTAMEESTYELKGLQLGAVDYITKPFSPPLLRKRVALHLLLENQKRELKNYNENLQDMVETKTKTIVKLQNKILAAMAEMVESRDGSTGVHIANTQRYLRTFLNEVIKAKICTEQSSTWDVDLLIQSSQLHDVGKIGISDDILKKPGRLNHEEFTEMQQHVRVGVGFIERLEDGEEDSRFLQYAKIFTAFHHEKWDGSGYPYGLAGEDIPMLGRIMAIVDEYDALTSARPYKKALSHEDAVAIILAGMGTSFDPSLAEVFVKAAQAFAQTP